MGDESPAGVRIVLPTNKAKLKKFRGRWTPEEVQNLLDISLTNLPIKTHTCTPHNNKRHFFRMSYSDRLSRCTKPKTGNGLVYLASCPLVCSVWAASLLISPSISRVASTAFGSEKTDVQCLHRYATTTDRWWQAKLNMKKKNHSGGRKSSNLGWSKDHGQEKKTCWWSL